MQAFKGGVNIYYFFSLVIQSLCLTLDGLGY